ncbi:flagellin [Inediibacterium massiliense]|uniref:flagellin N-terminal helical domain-containing protein n=1 Tax=Inediibacterium massiliense TaxID=1658111 RepID=UPI0006B53484|nr:flagellin [Inediibacterium massiliense]
MIINHNMMAMNTHRQMGINTNTGAKSIEKLSSGLRINRAGDDAAGLSISEKMRAQIRGLNQASRNGQDGISMIQTAEGALQETQAILQRMRELAVQSSNDTNVEIDRGAIQGEIKQLKNEIDRIGNTTEFNTQSLLKGDGSSSLDKTGLVTKSNLTGGDVTHTDATQALKVGSAFVKGDTVKLNLNGEEVTITFADTADNGKGAAKVFDVTGKSATVNLAASADATTSATAIKDALTKVIAANDKLAGNYTVAASGDTATITAGGDFEGSKGFIGASTIGGSGTVTGGTDSIGTTVYDKASGTIDFSSVSTDAKLEDLIKKGITINGQKVEFYNANDGAYKGDAVGVNISDALAATASKEVALSKAIADQLGDKLDGVSVTDNTDGTLTITAKEGGKAGNDITVSDGGVQEDFKASFQIGSNEGQTMEISIGDMRADALGIKDVDLSTREDAQKAITTLESAIASVSAQRSELGAFQNRLEHTIKNLDTSAENLQASESRIRDVDMAKEMMSFQKNNILQQAAQAMLAQANQAPQGVLQLLR